MFTYGPWGFLDYPLGVSTFNLVAAAVFGILTITATWLVFDGVLKRVLPEPWAAAATTLLVALASQVVTISSVLLVAAALAAMEFLGTPVAGRRWWLPASVSGCAAFLLQVKFSEGVILTGIAIACAVLAPAARLRRSAEAAGSYLLVTGCAWLAAGQSLAELPTWLRGATEVAQGYTEAMSLEGKPNVVGYLLIAAVIGISAAYLVAMARSRPDRRAVAGVVITVCLMLFLGFREGTGRHGPGHQHYFFLFALPAAAWFLPSARSVALRSAALVGTVLLSTVHWLPTEPQVALGQWGTMLQTVLDGQFRGTELARARTRAQRVYRLSPELKAAVEGVPVAVDPTEVTLPWAYGLEWNPAPAFQSYFAYTARLDRRNAQAITDGPADQAILRDATRAIDGRNILWDPPRYLLAELCGYRVAASDQHWMLLRKSSDRCSEAVTVSTERVEAGRPLTVPSAGPDQILVVSFTERAGSPAVRIGRVLDKSFHPLTVTAGTTRFRVPRGLADGPLLVRMPAAAGWPAAFGGATAYPSLTFSEAGTARFSVISLTG
ncbi:MAG TPA: hypothetical protein VGX49_14110 [Jatrophihabitans sp.]|nr:hypothetical protein [Jatrophihabitans sp.]